MELAEASYLPITLANTGNESQKKDGDSHPQVYFKINT
jgi:hypothetical protein